MASAPVKEDSKGISDNLEEISTTASGSNSSYEFGKPLGAKPIESSGKSVTMLESSHRPLREPSKDDSTAGDLTSATSPADDDIDEINFLSKALFLFSNTHPIRAFCINVVTNAWFNNFILVVILINAAFLAANDPLKDKKEGFNVVNYYADFIFLGIFLLEMIVKILAYGFALHPHSYMRNGWNWIDLIVVIVSILNLLPGFGNLTALRALRLLRPLRTVSRVQGMKIIVNSLLKGAQKMVNVFLLIVVVYVIFGGAAVQMWSGSLRQQCYSHAQVINDAPVYPDEHASFWQCTTQLDGRRCDSDQKCLPYGKNPGCGYINFDNIGYTWLQMYIIMTFDNWSSTMYALMDTWSVEAWIWFLLFAFVTVFFILNLTLAVVEESFSDEKERADDQERRRKEKSRRRKARLRAQGLTAREAALRLEKRDWLGRLKQYRPHTKTLWNMPENKVSHWLRSIFRHKYWGWFITVMIVANTAIMALDHYPQSAAWDRLQLVSNFIFTAIYTAEMVGKLLAIGPYGYISDPYNCLDGFLVVTSVVDLAASFINIKALRVLRLLRVARLMGKLKGMRVVMLMLRKSILPLLYITLVMFLYLFIFAVLGRQLFAGKFNPPPAGSPEGNCAGNPGDSVPRSNYDTFWSAFVTTFQISIFENWSQTMYYAMRGTSGAASIYYIVQTVIGVFMILNLFVAMLMHAFEEASDEVARNRDLKSDTELAPSSTPSQNDLSSIGNSSGDEEEERKKKASMLQIKVVGGEVHLQILDEDDIAEHEKKLQGSKQEIGHSQAVKRTYYIPPQTSFGFMSAKHPLRRLCIQIVVSKWFEWAIFIIVMLSCLFLAMDQPNVTEGSRLGRAIHGFNWIFAVLFTTEIAIKMIALGLFQHKGSFLREVWNILDLVITFFTILSLALPSVQAIRSFRAVRPLRLLTKSSRTKTVVMAFFRALLPIGNILLIVCIVWLIFAILGVQLWKGTFYNCTDDTITRREFCNGTFVLSDGEVLPRQWVTQDVNFNNVGEAFLTLARVATAASWLTPVWHAEDAVGVDRAMEVYYAPAAAMFFIVFSIIGGFFALSLFIAALMDQFHDQAKEVNGSAFLDEKQNLWLTFTRIVATASPAVRARKPEQFIRRICYYIVMHPVFDPFMMLIIGFNVFVILLAHYPSTTEWEQAFQVTNYLFLLVFLVEAIIKFIGLGPKAYFKEGWNIFDFTICLLTVAGGMAEIFITVPGSPSFLRVFRSLRLLRVFRFIPRLRDFINTLLFVLPSSLNVLVLLVVVWYIFAIVAMNVMAGLPQCDECNINRHFNFASFGASLLDVFILMTGDGWSDIMVEASLKNPANYLYFMALTFFVMLIMLNLFIAVVMEEFSSFKNTRHERLRLDNFVDPYGERRIPAMELVPMLWAMGDPLGFAGTMPLHAVFNALQIMDVPIYPDKTVKYEHVLQGLIRWGLQLDMAGMRFDYTEKELTGFTVAHLYATQTLQKVFRRRRAVRMLTKVLELKDLTPEEREKKLANEKREKELKLSRLTNSNVTARSEEEPWEKEMKEQEAKEEREKEKNRKEQEGGREQLERGRPVNKAFEKPAAGTKSGSPEGLIVTGARKEKSKKEKKDKKVRTPEEEQAHQERKLRRRSHAEKDSGL